jgi:hypothetical protein
MGQYTDKINAIAKDFRNMEDAESVSSLQATSGKMIISYKHGGERIEILRDDIEYEDIIYKKGDIIVTEPIDPYYISLKERYMGDPSWSERIGKWWKNRKKW